MTLQPLPRLSQRKLVLARADVINCTPTILAHAYRPQRQDWLRGTGRFLSITQCHFEQSFFSAFVLKLARPELGGLDNALEGEVGRGSLTTGFHSRMVP